MSSSDFIDSISYNTLVLRVEWAKSRARAARWKEELELLEEEMRRSIEFCRWRARWWTEQIGKRQDVSAPLLDGLTAYVHEQAEAEITRAEQWDEAWKAIRARAKHVLTHQLKETGDSSDDAEELRLLRRMERLVVHVNDEGEGEDDIEDDDVFVTLD